MRSKFDDGLNQLQSEMMRMGCMIETGIAGAVKAFLNQDVDTAKEIIRDDDLVDDAQKRIENLCFQLLIRQQPVARDLRNITAAMKMVTDMERIGDHAADISELTVEMSGAPYPLQGEDIRQMAAETIEMLIHSIESYVEKDADKAQEVIAHDDVVDELFLKVKAELIDLMHTKPEEGQSAADLLMVSKYLERVGDHATNIAEWVIFSLDNTPPDQM